jgi:hypothetical protein
LRQYVPLKRRVPFNGLHGVIFRKRELFRSVSGLNILLTANRRAFPAFLVIWLSLVAVRLVGSTSNPYLRGPTTGELSSASVFSVTEQFAGNS